jgi:hypothetical protein
MLKYGKDIITLKGNWCSIGAMANSISAGWNIEPLKLIFP